MPHWFGCFAEKKQYFKILKIHQRALKVVMAATETAISFFGIAISFTFIKDT